MAQQQFCSSAKLLLPRISVPTTIVLVLLLSQGTCSSVLVKAALRFRPAISILLRWHGAVRSAVFSGRLCRCACQLFLHAAALGLSSLAVCISAILLKPRTNHFRSLLIGCCCNSLFQPDCHLLPCTGQQAATTRTLVGRVTLNFFVSKFLFLCQS